MTDRAETDEFVDEALKEAREKLAEWFWLYGKASLTLTRDDDMWRWSVANSEAEDSLDE